MALADALAEAGLVEIQKLDDAILKRAREVAASDLILRQVARAAPCDGEVPAAVSFEAVRKDGPLGGLRDEWNALHILSEIGVLHVVKGRGAAVNSGSRAWQRC
jgi:homoserine dehydrogenase